MTYTFDLLDVDESALTWQVTTHENPKRAAAGLPPYPDNQAFVLAKMRELLAPVRVAYDRADADAVVDQYVRANLALRAKVKTDLGMP